MEHTSIMSPLLARNPMLRKRLYLITAGAAALALAACAGTPTTGVDRDSAATGSEQPQTRTLTGADASARDNGGSAPRRVGQTSQPVALNPDHPDRYVVERGDTLWGIAGRFLRDPWFWPEIWQVNPQIANPHLIFPGDVISLVYINGEPRLILERGRAERLSPRIREQRLDDAIPTIPYDAIRAFLSRPTVIPGDRIDRMPYVFTSRHGNLLASAGQEVYVRGTNGAAQDRYNVVNIGEPLVDPDDNAVVGYEGIHVGEGRISRSGDPATLFLEHTRREARRGDRLMPDTDIPTMNFFPRAPQQPVEGRVIHVTDGVSMIGTWMVVVINRGERDGLEPGHVLQVYEAGRVERDTIGGTGLFGQNVPLPDELAAQMMVFRTFVRISYGLVMEAYNEFRVHDIVRSPAD